jgi:hypothetical protein
VHTSGSLAISRKLAVLTPPVVAPVVGSLFSRLIRERSIVSRCKRSVTVAKGELAGGGAFVAPTELGIRSRGGYNASCCDRNTKPNRAEETLVRLRSKVAAMENLKFRLIHDRQLDNDE